MFFWYSEEYENMHGHKIPEGNYALLDDGRIIKYSQCTQEKASPGNWKDMKFLGEGKYHSRGVGR